MYENISDLIKQIALGEDSVLELKAVSGRLQVCGEKHAGLCHQSAQSD
jgi:hypothetical protein